MQTFPVSEHAKRRHAIVHWAGQKEKDFGFGGNWWTCPPCDVLGATPGLDADGDPIPGTTRVEDQYFAPNGMEGRPDGDPIFMSCDIIIKNVFGFDAGTGKLTSELAIAGLSYIPNNASKADIAAIVADGTDRWKEKDLVNAQAIVASFEARIDKARSSGAMPPPPGLPYRKAVAKLEAYSKAIMQDTDPASDTLSMDQIEFMAFAQAKARELALKAGENLSEKSRIELADDLLKQPEVLAGLEREHKIEIQRRGRAKPSAKALDKQLAEAKEIDAKFREAAQTVEL